MTGQNAPWKVDKTREATILALVVGKYLSSFVWVLGSVMKKEQEIAGAQKLHLHRDYQLISILHKICF